MDERVYLPLCEVADTLFHIQGDQYIDGAHTYIVTFIVFIYGGNGIISTPVIKRSFPPLCKVSEGTS